MNKVFRKFHRKIFGKLKCICIENVMEIVKMDIKTWWTAAIRQMFLPPMFLLYGI